ALIRLWLRLERGRHGSWRWNPGCQSWDAGGPPGCRAGVFCGLKLGYNCALVFSNTFHTLRSGTPTATNARVVKLVDAGDSKSPAARRAGSIPAPGTTLIFLLNSRS